MGLSAREKDRLWKLHKETREVIKDRFCNSRELNKPTERNVQKCMEEIRMTRNVSEPFKEAGRLLGEETNLNKYRRRGW